MRGMEEREERRREERGLPPDSTISSDVIQSQGEGEERGGGEKRGGGREEGRGERRNERGGKKETGKEKEEGGGKERAYLQIPPSLPAMYQPLLT
jgi:hypothetical protein